MNSDDPKPQPAPHNAVDAHNGGVFDSDGNEVYAKSLSQRSAIRHAYEDEWEEFCQRNEAPPCGPGCSCQKVSTK